MVGDTTDYRGVRLLVLAVLVILALTVLATPVAAGDFLFGDGSEDDPYEISTVEQLQAIETEPDAHFILVNDIDASGTVFWNGGAGFDPIGDSAEPFTGTVDGQDYEISGLTINRPSESDVALFGNVENDATIENLSLTDVDVTGETSVGSLGGRMSLGSDGRITDVSVSGDVTASGDTRVGGLAGETDDGTYERLSVSVDVTAQSATHVGGLAGRTVDGTYSEISASGDVTGDTEVGGLVGRTSYTGEFSDVYATGDVTGETDVGGVVGQTSSHETVFARVYSAGEVSGSENVGGFAGSADSLDDWTGVYWDAEVGPDDEYGDGHGVSIINDLTTSQMTGLRAPVYMDEFAFTDVWMPGEDNTSYPTFSRESTFEDGADAIDEHLVGDGDEVHPYQLTTIYEVQSMRENPTAHYILMNDIDASATAENWHFNDGFDPVGDSSDRFTGSFDGQGYEIADLTIDRWDENFIGLFGYAEDATIENVSLVDVDVLGADRVGGLVGQSVGGTYESVAASGTVSTQSHFGGGDYVGGLIGHTGSNSMTLENGSFEGTVEGESRVGGLIGFARAGSGSEEVIANSSADVTVSSGAGRSGGFVGIMLSQDNDVVVRDSVAQGAVEIPPETIHYIGGFIGKTEHHGVVSNVSAAVDVAGSRHVGGLIGHTSDYSTTIEDAHASGDVTGPWDTGGLIGTVETGNGVETIKNVSASGTVGDPDADRTIGGLIGRTAADDDLLVTNASALGDVNAPNAENVGGLVGTTGGEGEFRDVYATGDVSGEYRVGGLIGRTSLTTTFTRVYSGGTVSGSSTVGGFAGSRSTSDDLTAVYWDADVGPSEGYGDGTTDAELTGLTTDQMTGLRAAVYLDGFSFYDVWMPGEDDSSYPDLAWNADFEDGSEMVDALVTGDGDEANPYQLTNIYELQTMAAHRSAHYVLANDIDASVTGDLSEGAGFEPIGDSADRFTGTFDGQGYEISNLTIDRPGESNVGLFGRVDSTTIGNVSLVDVDVTGENRVGGLGGTISVDDRVADVSVSGAVTGTGSTRIGGMIGVTGDGTYERLSASVAVSAPDATHVGGLIGRTTHGTYSEVSSSGEVTGNAEVGGLIGYTTNDPTTIEDAHASGAVAGETDVGGLVGKAHEREGGVERYTNVSASGTVTDRGTGSRLGGLIGQMEPETGEIVVTNASATGDVDAPNADQVGGLVGQTSYGGELRDAYVTGNVTGGTDVGGVVGWTSGVTTTFTRVYSAGEVSGSSTVGGFAGSQSTKDDLTAVYWDTTVGPSDGYGDDTTDDELIGLTTDQMTGLSAEVYMDGFSFGTAWAVSPEYPLLTTEAADLSVTIDEVNASVLPGETVQVTATVENHGAESVETDVSLEFDGVEENRTTVTVSSSGSETVTLETTVSDSIDPGDYEVAVVADGAHDTTTVMVPEPANFTVEITGTNEPVTEGEDLEVDVTVENTGNLADTQTITLIDFTGSVVDSVDVTLDGHETNDSVTLVWETESGDAGTDDVTVESDNDSATESTTVNAPASFVVEITDTNEPITAGEDLEVDVTVENIANQTETQTITLADFNGTVVDSTDVTLDAGETNDSVTLVWETEAGDAGTDDVTVETGTEAVNETVTVTSQADFAVEVTGTNEPVTESQGLEVDVTVENEDDVANTQTITLTDFNGTVVDSTDVTLDDHETTDSVTLVWETEVGDAGTDDVTVASLSDSATESVTVIQLADFSIDITGTNEPVVGGDDLEVNVTVENTDTLTNTQTVALTDFDGTVVDSTDVTLSGQETNDSVTLVWETEAGDAGTDNVTVESWSDADSEEATVLAPASFAVDITDTNDPITAGNTLSVEVDVENVGEVSGTDNVSLIVDTNIIDEQTLTLDAAENETITLAWSTSSSDDGTHTISVESDTHADTDSVTVDSAPAPSPAPAPAPSPPSSSSTPPANSMVEWASEDYVRIGYNYLRDGEVQWANASEFNRVDEAFLSVGTAFAIEGTAVTPAGHGDASIEYEAVDGVLPETVDPAVLAAEHDAMALWSVNVTHQGTRIDEMRVAFSVADESIPPGIEAEELTLYRYDGETITEESTTYRGQNGDRHRYVSTLPDQSTLFVGGPLPDVMVTEASHTPDMVGVDEPVTVQATIENTADVEIAEQIAVTADGAVVNETQQSFRPGETIDVTFTPSFAEPGEKTLAVNGVDAGTVTVREPIENLSVETSLNRTEVAVNESVGVTVAVENTGELDWNGSIEVFADGTVVGSEHLSVAMNESANATLAVAFDEPGTYALETAVAPIGAVTVTPADDDGEPEVGDDDDGDEGDEADDVTFVGSVLGGDGLTGIVAMLVIVVSIVVVIWFLVTIHRLD